MRVDNSVHPPRWQLTTTLPDTYTTIFAAPAVAGGLDLPPTPYEWQCWLAEPCQSGNPIPRP
jgi:hypothetical protein